MLHLLSTMALKHRADTYTVGLELDFIQGLTFDSSLEAQYLDAG